MKERKKRKGKGKNERTKERRKERKGEARKGLRSSLAPFLRITCTSTSGALYYTIIVTKKLAIRPHPSDEDENKEYRVVAIFACAFVRVHTTERYGHMRASRRRNEKEKMKNREREKEYVEGSETGWVARGAAGGESGRKRERGREEDGRNEDRRSLYSYRTTVRACASRNTNTQVPHVNRGARTCTQC